MQGLAQIRLDVSEQRSPGSFLALVNQPTLTYALLLCFYVIPTVWLMIIIVDVEITMLDLP